MIMRWDIADLAGASVLVVGDIMLDEHVWGDVERISPEAPVPVVEVRRRTTAPGGAANTAAGVVALGGRVLLAGLTGDDLNAELLRIALRDAGVGLDGVLTEPGRCTTTKSRLLARGQHVVRIDIEHRVPPAPPTEERLVSYVRAAVQDVDVVVLSDYAKGVVSPRLARAVIDLAQRSDRPVITDPAGSDYRTYRGATLLTPSVDEVAAAVGRQVRTEEELSLAGVELVTLLSGTEVLITRGAAGMWLMSRAGVALDIPTRARTVYDVTGAGDTVVATMAVAMARGVPIRVAVTLANAAAGIAVGKAGTASVSLDELEREMVADDYVGANQL